LRFPAWHLSITEISYATGFSSASHYTKTFREMMGCTPLKFRKDYSKNDFSKLTDVSIITDKEIQQQVVSSVGGAVAGGLLFGPGGAMIGGRAKQRTATRVRYYLIFSYEKDGSVSYIAFEATQSITNASKFAKEFHAGDGGTGKKIEL